MEFPVDLTGQKVTLDAMSLTMAKKQLIQTMMANIVTLNTGHDNLTDKVQEGLNDLNTLLEQSQLADDIDIDKINETLTATQALISESGEGANILAGIGQLYTEMNRREETKTNDYVVNGNNGVLLIDLATFSFGAVTDYSLQCSLYGSKPLTVAVDKISATQGRVIVTDHTLWEFNDERFYDASAEGAAVTVAVTVTRTPVSITKTFTEVDGDTKTVG